MKAGIIGVGTMGLPIAEHLLAQERALIVHDTDAAAVKPLADRQARVAGSPAEVASEAEIVFACLPSLAAFHEVACGAKGVVAGTATRIFVNLGTTGSVASKAVAGTLAEKSILTVDAPVSGGAPRAREGTLTVMASGPKAAFDEVEPLLNAFGTSVAYLGDAPGAAQTMKLINNIMSATNLAIGCEALVMGAKAGLDPEVMLQVLNNGSGQNSATLTKIPDHILTRDFDYGGGLYITEKDLGLWQAEAEALGVPHWVGAAARQLYMHAIAIGGREGDMTELIKFLEQWAGCEVPKTR
jgi:3-hydroxyisobutyrate dehydrogenase-like beta-hydroxyacid dehydrogenase